jgi:hypothetical protein
MTGGGMMQRRLRSVGRSRTLPVDEALLARLAFTDHAIERFAQRAGLGTSNRQIIEPIARAVLHLEGLVVHERPDWARSRNRADMYLQAGSWMLFIACEDQRSGAGSYAVVTVINNPRAWTWMKARRRRMTRTTAPRFRPRRTRLLASIAAAVREPRVGGQADGVLAMVRRTHAERRARAHVEYEQRLAIYAASGGVYGGRA